MPGRQAGSPIAVYMRKYNAQSQKQGRKRFNYIVKTIHFSYLPIIYLWFKPSPLCPISYHSPLPTVPSCHGSSFEKLNIFAPGIGARKRLTDTRTVLPVHEPRCPTKSYSHIRAEVVTLGLKKTDW